MVRYWCNGCGTEHDNARDCPLHISMRENENIGKRIGKTKKDMNRRASKKDNDARDTKGWDCFPVLVGIVSLPTVVIWGAVELLNHLL